MAVIRSILTKEPKERSSQEVKQVQMKFNDNKFFATVKEERDEKSYYELCERLRIEEHEAGEAVFNYGDTGSQFYIIIEGSVEVKVPSVVILEQDSATPEGLISFLIIYFDEIYWQEVPMSKHVLGALYSEFRTSGIAVNQDGSFDKKLAL